MKYLFAFFIQIIFFFSLSAQGYFLKGAFVDAKDNSPLVSATLILTSLDDAAFKQFYRTDLDGNFQFKELKNGTYLLKCTYIGYNEKEITVKIKSKDVLLGKITVDAKEKILRDVTITEKGIRVEQKGDTSEYNAKSFKVNKDATAEDLITKMPGVINDNGTIKAQGEQVKKVLIDGKEFFGDDVNAAIKNVPAEMIDKVQIFDAMSDQSQFSGFDDGNTQKTMNIKTKSGMNNGVFGKIYGSLGYSTDMRYAAGANINWFKGDRRLSFIGMSNNINQQNFSTQDIMGVIGSTSSGSAPRGGGRGRGGSGGFGGDNPMSNFLVGQQNGIATTHAYGINYADVWGKKNNIKVTGSYFFNLADNITQSSTNRKYFNNGDSSLLYLENSDGRNKNINHRINMRFQYDIDSVNSFIFTPKLSIQQNTQQSSNLGTNTYSTENPLSKTTNTYSTENLGYNFSTDILYRHKFSLPAQTISVNVTPSINTKNSTTTQFSNSIYYAIKDTATLDQKIDNNSANYGISGSVNYTQPISKSEVLQFNYAPSYTWNHADKQTNQIDPLTSMYTLFDTMLSNKYDNNYSTQRFGISYRISKKTFNLTIGANTQYALLTGNSVFPYAYKTKKEFLNSLPNVQLNYKFKNTATFRLNYRTSTTAPSISQLQSVINNNNPVQLSTGNPDLKQNYSHNISARYNYTNKKNAQSFFVFTSANFIQNYIGNSTLIAIKDTVLNDNVTLYKGSQLTAPKNLSGNMSLNTFITYGFPLTALKCNLNLNTGFSYSKTPSEINNTLNLSNAYTYTGGVVLGSNISEKIDFNIHYFGNYYVIKNTLQTSSNNNYFSHTANVRLNYQFWKEFTCSSTLQNTMYAGISNGFNQNVFVWNAALGYKFLKDKSLEVKFGVNDILSQNNGISRTVTETYVEDAQNKILKRYSTLTLTYNLKRFNKTPSKM